MMSEDSEDVMSEDSEDVMSVVQEIRDLVRMDLPSDVFALLRNGAYCKLALPITNDGRDFFSLGVYVWADHLEMTMELNSIMIRRWIVQHGNRPLGLERT